MGCRMNGSDSRLTCALPFDPYKGMTSKEQPEPPTAVNRTQSAPNIKDNITDAVEFKLIILALQYQMPHITSICHCSNRSNTRRSEHELSGYKWSETSQQTAGVSFSANMVYGLKKIKVRHALYDAL